MQIKTSHNLELPSGLRHKLESYRRRVWFVKVAEGVLAGLFGLLLSYLLVFTLDRFGDTPATLRWLLLLAGAAGLAIWFPLKWHRWVWQTRQLEQAARLLRRHFPRIGDQLLGIIELAHNEIEQERSVSLCRAAMRQVDERVRDRDFSSAVPHPRHGRWAWVTSLTLLIALVVLVAVPSAGINALARWLLPWREIDRYTFVQLESLPDQLVVPYAEPFQVHALLSASSPWKPREGKARFGPQTPVPAQRTERGYRFELPPQKQAGRLAIAVGDARQAIEIAPSLRPELTAIEAHVDLPDYLQYDSFPDQDVRGGSLSVVHGSRVSVTARATRPLAEAHVNERLATVNGDRFALSELPIAKTTRLQLRWRDQLGLSAKEPFQLTITAVADEAPHVTCSKLQREQVVASTDPVTFEFSARDDYGVKLIGLQWKGIPDQLRNPHPSEGETILAVGAPESSELTTAAAFSTQRLGIPPQSLEVRLFAIDYLPGRERVYSSTYTLHVLSPEEHAIWLTRQMRKWFQQANEVYEREQQLLNENQALRAMPKDQLDQPETRRRIETQAASEAANARRLGALTSEGEELITRATRNEQFNVATLEKWAQMLQTLEEIAEHRMPSVADLLTQAATAPGQSSNTPASASPPPKSPAGKTPPQVGQNRDPRAAPGDQAEAAEDKAPVPGITDIESGFNELEKTPGEPPPSKQSDPSLRLPTTDIVGGGAKQPQSQPRDRQPEGADQKLDEAVTEQEALLAEFAKVAEELKKLLSELEGSTFVKRLKAAARRQLEIAGELNESLQEGFGIDSFKIPQEQKEQLGTIAEREIGQGDVVYVIQDDLEAYFNRVQQGKFRTVLREMKSSQVVSNLQVIAKLVERNRTGQSIAEAEFWADTMDRWAEQLVGPG